MSGKKLPKSPQVRIPGGKADKRDERRRNSISWQMRMYLAHSEYHGPACGCGVVLKRELMAKIFLWTDPYAPPLIVEEGGAVISFYDYPELWNFEVNDQIHYKTRLGTTVFSVEKVEPANELNYPKTMRKVTARKITNDAHDRTISRMAR